MKISINDVTLNVESFGKGQHTVVAIHGGPDWDHTYLRSAMEPIGTIAKVVLFDIRGCGLSTAPSSDSGYHMDKIVDDVKALLFELNIEHGILLGYSYGGRVAMRFAQYYGEHLSALILASTTAYEDFHDELEEWPEYRKRMTKELQAKLDEIRHSEELTHAEKALELALISCSTDVYDEASIPLVQRALEKMHIQGHWTRLWLEKKLPKVNHGDYASVLTRLNIPTLIVHGEKDMCFPLSVAHRLYEAVPHSKLSMLNGAGHLVALEKPEEWARAIIEFMNSTLPQ